MTLLIFGLALFFAVHTVPMAQTVKATLTSRFGENRYKLLFTFFSLAGFVGIVAGMQRAPFSPVWNPPAWAVTATSIAMPIVFCLLAAAYLPNNFRRVMRNPMLSATFLWALAHLLSNGDTASILLFGSFGAFAVIDILSVNRRSKQPIVERKPLYFDVLTIAIGLVAFWVVRYYHGALFGVPVAY